MEFLGNKEFSNITAQGYEVIAIFGENNDYTVIYRPSTKDYIVAWEYNENDGTWSQGHYGFESYKDCVNWIYDYSNISRELKSQDGLNFGYVSLYDL